MKVAVIQITSVLDYKVNLAKINSLISKAKSDEQVDTFFLPEVFYSMSDGQSPTPYLVEQSNEHYKNIQKIATDHQVYIIGGTAATALDGKVVNRTYSFKPNGEQFPHYDKMHLFAIKSVKNVIDEASVYTGGDEIVDFSLNRDWKVGLSTCFDIRFPELYRELYKREVNIITAASAFTIPTGRAHWETLLRSRAIENQSYVIAANQVGVHNKKLSTYGHSMIIDPWGKVLAEIADEEGYICADLDLALISKIRSRICMQSKIM